MSNEHGMSTVRAVGPAEVRADDGALAARLLALAARVEDVDGVAALSEQHELALRHGDPRASWLLAHAREGAVVGVASLIDGSVELLVDPAHRLHGHGLALASEALAAGGPGPGARLWAYGDLPGARALAAALGAVRVRELLLMSRPAATGDVARGEAALARASQRDLMIRAFDPESKDGEAWTALNARAFASHPEQGSLTVADFRLRAAEPWFDPTLLWFAFASDDVARPLGSLWVKRAGVVAEIYALGVDPDAQGRGIGRLLTDIALGAAAQRGCTEVELYVEGDNAAALALYRAAGFTTRRLNVQYATSNDG